MQYPNRDGAPSPPPAPPLAKEPSDVTLLEQPTRGDQPEQPEPPQLKAPMFAAAARRLAEQWRVLPRLATGVAILTAPFFFLLLYQVGGWTLAAAIFVTLLAVVMFRGLVEVLTRKF